ncbi:MAG: DUF2147 domain-containing protein [Caulobacteraceae bacterium]
MSRRFALAALFTAAALTGSPFAFADVGDSVDGVWRNPHDSLHIEVKACGTGTCGYVIWASDKAKADAKRGGTENLVGTQLLRDFSPDKRGSWRGKVFVPDRNAIFSGSAELVDANTLRAKGCLFANIICRSQIWTRIERNARAAG